MDEKIYREYDKLVNQTIQNIYAISKDQNKIVLVNLNPKNREHLYIFRVALMARDIFNMPLYIKIGFFKWAKLNWKMRKGFNRVPRIKETGNQVIDVPMLLKHEREQGCEALGANFGFEQIYKTYYEGSLD